MKSILKINTFPSVLFYLSIILFSACSEKKDAPPPKVDPAFTGYVSAFTSGVISNEGTIIVDLREPIAGAEKEKKNRTRTF